MRPSQAQAHGASATRYRTNGSAADDIPLRAGVLVGALANSIASHINIPFTVGGGIGSLEDVASLLQNGADKISVNTAAFKRPALLTEMAREFGSQCIVLAIDTKKEGDDWYVYLNGGRIKTTVKTIDWAATAVAAGAGEILLTSMDKDGTKNGFDLAITAALSDSLSVPVIASGGAGTMQHFAEVFEQGKADAALAASIFHYKEIDIPVLKHYLLKNNINIRPHSVNTPAQ